MPRTLSRLDRKNFPVDFAFFALLVLITVTITVLYVSQERNFHWWIDWYYRAIEVATAFRKSPSEAIQQVLQSLVGDRNKIYTLPLVPFILLFGESRLVYELSLALVYLLPFSLVMGAISTRLILANPQTVFWSTALLTLLIPVSWVPTFLGVPDTGGALLIALAVLVYLHDVRLKVWRIPVIGFLIALAIILRRHFVYDGIAFLSAVTLQALIFFFASVRQNPHIALRKLSLVGVRIGLIAATIIITLLTFTWEFTYRALITDYRNLYASWSLPFNIIIGLYASFYGWTTWMLVAIGFSAGILTKSSPQRAFRYGARTMTRVLSLPTASFICLLGIFSLIEWLVVLRYGNVFYTLHVTPLVVMGLAAFIWTTSSALTGKVRTLMLGFTGCYLVGNIVIGLTPIGGFDNAFRPLFALSIPPLVRTDYDEVVRLIDYLRKLAPDKQPIYIVGYQRLQLNSSMVKAASRILYGGEHNTLNIMRTPQFDSQDFYPLETLLQAQYVVVPNPLPYYQGDFTKVPAAGEWLLPKAYDVVKVVFDAFTQNWDIAQDFKRLPVQFKLEGGAVVNIYKRSRPTSLKTAVRTLWIMQQQIGKRPGGQLDWIILSQLFNNSSVIKNLNNTYKLVTHPSDRTKQQTTSFLYVGTLPETAKITGRMTFLDNRCSGLSLRAAMLDKEGKTVSSTENQYSPNNSSSFSLSIQGKDSAYLLLDVLSYDKNDLINHCTLEINSLVVSPQK